MNTDRVSLVAAQPQPATRITLSRGWLWTGRLVWLALTALVLLTLSQIWPQNYWVTYGEWIVTETRSAVQTVMPYGDFVRLVTILESLSTAITLLTGFVIFWYKSNDKMGLFVSTFLILVAPWILSSNMDTWRLPVWMPLKSSLIFLLTAGTLGSLVLFFYLFPDGRFVPRWTRWPALLLCIMFGAYVLLGVFLHIPAPFANMWAIFTTAFFAALVIAVGAQLYRYRTCTDPGQRQQMKWVVLGFGFYIILVVPLSLGVLLPAFTWGPVINLLGLMLAQCFIPLAIGFSILRYRLWDIDLIINRTVVYGGLTLLVTVVYVLIVGLMSNLFQSGSSLALSVFATGLIAILFNPVRQRLQAAVNRLMYGERDDPITVLTALGRRLEETIAPAETLPTFVETIAQALKLPYVAIVGNGGVSEQTSRAAAEVLAAYPSPLATHPAPLAFPLIYHAQTIGQLLVASRAPGEAFTPAERRLLENVARQAGTAVHAARLTADLQRSRERLVTAREEERRRLRRDLHDGLGPQLATLTLKVDAARNYLRQGPETTRPDSIETTDHLLLELKREIQEAIQDIRQLAYNLRPPALDQLGLAPALREYAAQNSANGLLITVDAPAALPPLAAAVEVAAYRIALEAITNVVRHARATHCRVNLSVIGDGLYLEINDNGVGLPEGAVSGVGLASMRERAAELGGAFDLRSVPGEGTQVSIRLPMLQS